MVTLLALVVLAAGWLAGTQIANAQSGDALVDKYTPLAGSEANAKTLVGGLREGKEFSLDGTTFKTPTHKLGNGEVNIALSLAEAKLRQQGITQPTSAQLNTALMGDATQPGILALRADGKGWGQIAQSMGIKVGDVMRAEQARRERHERPQVAKHERPERGERPDRAERPEKPERPERPEKPERHGR
jgi:hypothetical protein